MKHKSTSKHDEPIIYGSFTNWKPQRMMEIKRFCYLIVNQEPLDLLSAFTDAETGEPITAYEQLNEHQRR